MSPRPCSDGVMIASAFDFILQMSTVGLKKPPGLAPGLEAGKWGALFVLQEPLLPFSHHKVTQASCKLIFSQKAKKGLDPLLSPT